MSYHADMMSLFSRRSDSTSAWSSTCCRLGQVGWRERERRGGSYRALFCAFGLCLRELRAECVVDVGLLLKVLEDC
jgi:hypothetical protein